MLERAISELAQVDGAVARPDSELTPTLADPSPHCMAVPLAVT
jgi:hypothetical protein